MPIFVQGTAGGNQERTGGTASQYPSHGVWQDHDFWAPGKCPLPQQLCWGLLKKVSWVCNSSKWCRLRVLRLAPQASCLPEIMTRPSLKPWAATVELGWVRITCDGALHCACVREAPVLSGRVSQTGFGDNSLLYMIWASVPNSIFLSLPSLQLCEWLKVSMFANHFSNSVGRVLSDVKDREWNMETVTVVSQIKGPIAFCFFSLCSYTADTDTNSKLFTYLLISAENTNTLPTFTRIQLLMWVNSFSPPSTRCSRANPSMWQINNQLE